MKWFTEYNKEKGEVCGFLDLNKRFFEKEEDRNKSNEKIEWNNLESNLRSNIENLFDNGGRFPSYEDHKAVERVIELISRNTSIFALLKLYIQYNLRRETLKKKYGK